VKIASTRANNKTAEKVIIATDADFVLYRMPGSPRRASSGYAWAVLSWTITKMAFALKPAWSKGEAHRAEAKFWVLFFCGRNGNEL